MLKRMIAAALIVALMVGRAVIAHAKTDDGYNLTTVSGITADELRPFMHPESRHLAEDVVRICDEQGISAEFIATVMRWERRPDLHNWFGWTNNRGQIMRFKDDVTCLETVIPRIKALYLTEGGRYFNGYTVDAVSIRYNNSEFWRDTIKNGTLWIVKGAEQK